MICDDTPSPIDEDIVPAYLHKEVTGSPPCGCTTLSLLWAEASGSEMCCFIHTPASISMRSWFEFQVFATNASNLIQPDDREGRE